MSTVTRPAHVATPPPSPTSTRLRNPIRREDLSNRPTRKGRPGARAFFAEIGVHGITDTRIRNATEQGELRRFKIAGHNWYADVDLWDWLQTLASGGSGGSGGAS